MRVRLHQNRILSKATPAGGWRSQLFSNLEQMRVMCMLACAALDALAIYAGFSTAEAIQHYRWLDPGGVPLGIIMSAAFLYLAATYEAYSTPTLIRVSSSVVAAWRALIACLLGLIVCIFLMHLANSFSRLALFYATVAAGLYLAISRTCCALAIRGLFKGGFSHDIVITDQEGGNYPDSAEVINTAEHRLIPDLNDPVQVARISELLSGCDRVILDCSMSARDAWIVLLKATGVSCELIVPSSSIYAAVGVGQFGIRDTLILSRGPLSLGSRIKKRAFDLVLTLTILVLTGPLMLITALLIRLESPGPALFAQERVGQGNKTFRIYKFRSMRQASSDARGDRSTGRDDDRVTRIGRFIRRTSIDELPQFFNVLMGDMSIIGPRPHALGSRAGEQLFWEVSDRYWMRHALKPGITGLAQIKGYRGATEQKEDLEARLRYDLEYLQSWSLRNDLAILLATLRVVVHENAY